MAPRLVLPSGAVDPGVDRGLDPGVEPGMEPGMEVVTLLWHGVLEELGSRLTRYVDVGAVAGAWLVGPEVGREVGPRRLARSARRCLRRRARALLSCWAGPASVDVLWSASPGPLVVVQGPVEGGPEGPDGSPSLLGAFVAVPFLKV